MRETLELNFCWHCFSGVAIFSCQRWGSWVRGGVLTVDAKFQEPLTSLEEFIFSVENNYTNKVRFTAARSNLPLISNNGTDSSTSKQSQHMFEQWDSDVLYYKYQPELSLLSGPQTLNTFIGSKARKQVGKRTLRDFYKNLTGQKAGHKASEDAKANQDHPWSWRNEA